MLEKEQSAATVIPHKEIIPIFNATRQSKFRLAQCWLIVIVVDYFIIPVVVLIFVIMLLILYFYYICFVNVELIFIQDKFNSATFGHWQMSSKL